MEVVEMNLNELLQINPFSPYIRECDYAVRPPWYFPERRLLDYLLVYFQEGNCLFEIDGEEYHFSPGDFCFAQPGSLKVMRGLTPTVTPFAHFDMFYNPLREESFPTRAGQTDLKDYLHLIQPCLNDIDGIHIPVRLHPKDPEKFRMTMLRMVESWQNRDPLRQMEAQSLASELIVRIIYDHNGIRFSEMETLPSFNWFPSYLSLHLSESVTVEDMARRANLSVSRFREVFKKTFDMPPHKYLMHIRIQHAKELLINTEYSVEKIAEYCGFADIHHLSKTFKKMVGITPSFFRNNHNTTTNLAKSRYSENLL